MRFATTNRHTQIVQGVAVGVFLRLWGEKTDIGGVNFLTFGYLCIK